MNKLRGLSEWALRSPGVFAEAIGALLSLAWRSGSEQAYLQLYKSHKYWKGSHMKAETTLFGPQRWESKGSGGQLRLGHSEKKFK